MSTGKTAATPGKADKERETCLAPIATAIKAGKALLTRHIHGAEQKLQQLDQVPPSKHFITVLQECQSQICEAV